MSDFTHLVTGRVDLFPVQNEYEISEVWIITSSCRLHHQYRPCTHVDRGMLLKDQAPTKYQQLIKLNVNNCEVYMLQDSNHLNCIFDKMPDEWLIELIKTPFMSVVL